MKPPEFAQRIAQLAALDEPVRRDLYLYVASRAEEVGRDEAARAVGVSRTLAGFHLDRLAEDGLLVTSFRRLSGRTGPGAGRPAKLYRRADREVAVSVPPRSYELAARILATALESSADARTESALRSVARGIGRRIGAEEAARATSRTTSRAGSRTAKRGRARPAPNAETVSTMATLAAHGYEPVEADGAIRLRNCPFHALVAEHRELVCGMNLALIEGVVTALGLEGVEPILDPQPGMCCVALKVPRGR